MGCKTYSRLYHACVCPVLDYSSEIWGAKDYQKIDSIQNRAIRVYLGVHNYAANVAINGDMGWTTSQVRPQIVLRFWNRLVNMDENRLTKAIFDWDRNICCKNWSSDVKTLMNSIDFQDNFNEILPVSLNSAWSLLHEKFTINWKEKLQNTPKLRTYKIFKEIYCTEFYVTSCLNRRQKSTMAKLRCGILPLETETGRWRSAPVEERLCKLCNDDIENEIHF